MSKASAAAKKAPAQRAPGKRPPEPGMENLDALGKVAGAWRLGGRDYLPYRITLLAKLLDRVNTRLLQDASGLSVAEWRVLAQLSHASPSSVRQLAEQAWVDRAEVSRAAASLEEDGYIERRGNPKDRRSPLLYCTDRGRALARKVSPVRQEFHKSLTDLLSPQQTVALEQAMLILAKTCIDDLDAEARKPRRAPVKRRIGGKA
jgi:DNA-binding MarR family transcriptional regulator